MGRRTKILPVLFIFIKAFRVLSAEKPRQDADGSSSSADRPSSFPPPSLTVNLPPDRLRPCFCFIPFCDSCILSFCSLSAFLLVRGSVCHMFLRSCVHFQPGILVCDTFGHRARALRLVDSRFVLSDRDWEAKTLSAGAKNCSFLLQQAGSGQNREIVPQVH